MIRVIALSHSQSNTRWRSNSLKTSYDKLKAIELVLIQKDYFSVNDPFIEDVGSDEMKKIGDLFSVGDAPEDDAPVTDHETYQKSKVLKLYKFETK